MTTIDDDIGFWDSVLIENLTEDTFIDNLYQRYKRGLIYTYIGAFLVTINPYKRLTNYTAETIHNYAISSFFKLPPHIYGISNLAYQNLRDLNEHQCICILGESSAGKTETSRFIIHFLTHVSKEHKRSACNTASGRSLMRCKSLVSYPHDYQDSEIRSAVFGSVRGNSDSCFKKKTSGKSVEFADFEHQYKSLDNISQSWPNSNNYPNLNSRVILKRSSNYIDKNDLFLKSANYSSNKNSNRKIYASNPLSFDKSPLSRSNYLKSPITSNLKCEQCGHIQCHRISNNIATTGKKVFNNFSPNLHEIKNVRHRSYFPNISFEHKHTDAYSCSTSSLNHSFGCDESDDLIIKKRIANAQIFLESIGNASTVTNVNSSRFGKFLDIEIDYKGDPIAAHITYYMLEKSRVTERSAGDRNFHIFYQLLSGADIQFLKSLKLQRNIDKYELLKHTELFESDKGNFSHTKKSLETIGFNKEEIVNVFKIIAVILKLGNLIFIPTTNIDGTEGCEVTNEYELLEVADLLKIDYQILLNCLIKGSNKWSHVDVCLEIDAMSALRIANSLCRILYGRLFTWIITKINEALKAKQNSVHGKNLGILDFYGFENNELNKFEQLIINYCNEKLYQNFLQNIMKYQQELYVKESLEWIKIDFFDNESICDLIDKNNYGILNVLDEPHIKDDEAFIIRMHQCCAGHPNYLSDDSGLDSFQIRHYAGQVKYSVIGFVEKNSDNIYRNITSGLYQSKLSIVQNLFPEGNPKRTPRQPASVSSNIRVQLQALLLLIKNRRTHHIFCIKPNESKKSNIFELSLVQHQIRYLNLMPLVNIWRLGHCFHMNHVNFLNRYKLLHADTWPHYQQGNVIDGITTIIRALPLPAAEFMIGITKVFIRSPRTVYEMEEFRRCRLQDLAILIQKKFRSYSKRKHYLRLKQSQIIIARAWRTWRECRFGVPFAGRRHLWGLYKVAKEEYRAMKYRKETKWAVSVIQRHYIQWKRRQFLLTLLLRLPPNSLSPTCNEWITAPRFLTETSLLLNNIYHRWRCYKYRKLFDQVSKNRMREKVTASIIFKNRKSSYVFSVSHPFIGDYLRLRQNIQWKKMCLTSNDQYVVFADIINKITRSSGKFVPILMVLSTNSMLLLDQRTLQLKYRVPATEIYRLSLSPYHDNIAAFHIKASEVGRKKGDFVFQTAHVIEVVTKLFLVIQNAVGRPPDVRIEPEFEVTFGNQTVALSFNCTGISDILNKQPKVYRKANRMEINV